MKISKEFTAKAKKTIRERSGGVCEACGKVPATQVHHRLYKSRGGRGNVANGLAVCGFGNAGGCHGIAHTAKGEQQGWSIRSGFYPLKVPVSHATHGLVTFDDDGGFETTNGYGVAW